MIEKLQFIAVNTRWAKVFINIVGLGALGLLVYSILAAPGSGQDAYLIPSLLTIIWTLLFNIIVTGFINIPAKANKEDGFFKRMKANFFRSFYWLLGVTFVVLSFAVLMMSFKLFGIWLHDFL